MKVIEQDILTVSGPAVICHQVNCKGIMGGGLALQIKNQWPHVFDVYTDKTDWQLGDCQLIEIDWSNGQFIANLAGQNDIGGECDTNYIALSQALRAARDFADANARSLYIPYGIGCGLAGGNWDIVSNMIDTIAPNAIVCKFIP